MIETRSLIETETSTTDGKRRVFVLAQPENDRYSLSERMKWIPT
jgi:hypothetical protein